MIGKLEPEFEVPWQAYQDNPTPQSRGSLLRSLQPAIDKGLKAYGGKNVNSTMKSHAKRMALDAIRSYQPEQAKLSTHVINHLKGLQRIQNQRMIISTPERQLLDQRRMWTAQQELEEAKGREPSDLELADYMGISLKRIQMLRGRANPVSEGQLETAPGMEGFAPAVRNESDAWIHAVYQDLNPINRKIFEWTTGFNGQQVLSNDEIARRLRITPGAVSQRKAQIQQLLDLEEEISPF